MTSTPVLLAVAALVGRVMLALIFVISGLFKIPGFSATAGYMASKGLPMVELLLILTILIEVGGGSLLMLGWHARLAALAIFLFLIPVTVIFHPFWAVEASKFQGEFNNFMKNLAIMGGMLYVATFGPGPLSLGEKSKR